MNLEDTGLGAGIGGLVTSVLMVLGIKGRVDRVENRQDKIDNVYADLMAKVANLVGACDATHQSLNENITEMKNDIKTLLTRRRDDRKDDHPMS